MAELDRDMAQGFVSEISKIAKKKEKKSLVGSVGRGAAVGAILGAYPAYRAGKAASKGHRRVTSKYMARRGVQAGLKQLREVPLPPTMSAARFMLRGPRRFGMAVGAMPLAATTALGGGIGLLSNIIRRLKARKAKK